VGTKYQYRYEVVSWIGLIQIIVQLVGQGYFFWHLTYIPTEKFNAFRPKRLAAVDEKIINKYKTRKNENQRAYAKSKGLANFYYLRWQNVIVILHTLGQIDPKIVYDDKFFDIRKTPLILRVGEFSAYKIQIVNNTVNVVMEREFYRSIKAGLQEVAKTKNKFKMIKAFDRLNGIPAWSGIIKQKMSLAEFLVREAKKHSVQLSLNDLRIVKKRTPVKVFRE